MQKFQAETPGVTKSGIDTPALLIDIEAMENNLERMAEFFRGSEVRLRPHFKTHKTPIIAHKQMAAGAKGITCQKLGEAEVLVGAGIADILIASQIVGSQKISRLAGLAHHAHLVVAVDQADNVRELSQAVSAAGSSLRVVVEVDVGFERCGVLPGEAAVSLAELVSQSPGLEFAGLMGYEGHAVFMTDRQSREQAVREALARLVRTAELVRQAGLAVDIVSAGATGTYDMVGRFPGVNEIQAGSYVLMDTRYREVGVGFRCALTVLATVISLPAPGRAVIDAGKKTVSADFGLPTVISPDGLRLVRLSEEHGILEVDRQAEALRVGDRVELIPSHVCTTVNQNDRFYALRRGHLEGIWPIAARGKSQ
ncbi:MAG TPA: DSD1 family PLP-dependent enzyme [Anaerolineales bacterium]|nr:DSD1 family PLP-dependent enzyme [Anaerolineales bacterium]